MILIKIFKRFYLVIRHKLINFAVVIFFTMLVF